MKVRHIQFSPKDDPTGAADLPATDPAWATAKADADAAYEKLKADPSLFDSMARTTSDEESAKGDTGTGGKLGYISADSDLSQAEDFKTAILAPGLQPGQLLAPVKTDIGWHVIQVMYHAPDATWMAKLKTDADGGADFAALARDNSEAETASKGGDLGWVAPNQLDPRLTDAIFAARGRQDQQHRLDHRRRDVPVQGLRRGEQDAGGPAAGGHQDERVLELVHGPEGRGQDRARPVDHGIQRGLAGGACWMPSWPRRGCAGDWIRARASSWSPPSGSSARPSSRRGPC